MYELDFRKPDTTTTESRPFTLASIAEAVRLAARLADREQLPPMELDAALTARSDAHSRACGSVGRTVGTSANGAGELAFVPGFPLDRMFPGTYFLEGVGVDRTRRYSRRPHDARRARGGPLAPSLLPVVAAAGSVEGGEDKVDAPSTASASSQAGGAEQSQVARMNGAPSSDGLVNGMKNMSVNGNGTEANGCGAKNVATGADAGGLAARIGALLPRVVVTGVACGLPGQENVFEEDNLARLLRGQGCVARLPAKSMAALVEKNVVQVRLCFSIVLSTICASCGSIRTRGTPCGMTDGGGVVHNAFVLLGLCRRTAATGCHSASEGADDFGFSIGLIDDLLIDPLL